MNLKRKRFCSSTMKKFAALVFISYKAHCLVKLDSCHATQIEAAWARTSVLQKLTQPLPI